LQLKAGSGSSQAGEARLAGGGKEEVCQSFPGEAMGSYFCILESQNHYGWKRPLRSSPTVNPSSPCLLSW